ncbi:MAG TPA: flagellar protein FlbD [Spirochaetia bacterium]|nr:MAG: hypothetical protein A2Y41_10215 [Spirochaetes bacterium GWB1_36_13]HCL55538.1 flagellar protein FlbD [Spirochaetia bacterium]
MIELNKLNGNVIFVNPHLIETIEPGSDTRINFFTGKTMIVKNTLEEVLEKIVEYRRKLGQNSQEL